MTDPPASSSGGTRVSGVTSRIHYSWVIALLGMATVFAALGIARFSLGMLLPSMQADLHLSYTTLGWIGTGNFVGYLTGALGSGAIVARLAARRTVALSLFTITAGLLVVATAGGPAVIFPAYLITGVASGVANVAIMGLVPHWFDRTLRGRASGIIVVGSGFALMLSGVLVPALNDRQGAGGWRLGWGLLALAVLIVAIIVAAFLRNDPAELGLTAHGRPQVVATAGASRTVTATPPPGAGSRRLGRTRGPVRVQSLLRTMVHLGAVYFLFGVTYVVYITFIVATLVERGFSERMAGRFWIIVGLLSIMSGPLFGSLSDRAGRRIGLAVVFTLHAVAYLLVGWVLPGSLALYASVVLFGISAWSIPGIMGATVGDYVGPAQAATVFGRLTVAFGAGQAVGPVLAGAMAEATGSFAFGFLVTAALAGVAAGLSVLLRPPRASW